MHLLQQITIICYILFLKCVCVYIPNYLNILSPESQTPTTREAMKYWFSKSTNAISSWCWQNECAQTLEMRCNCEFTQWIVTRQHWWCVMTYSSLKVTKKWHFLLTKSNFHTILNDTNSVTWSKNVRIFPARGYIKPWQIGQCKMPIKIL